MMTLWKYTLIAMVILATGCMQSEKPKDVRTYEDCVNAGYQVTDSAPRQCRTPDGRTMISDKDVFDATRDISCGDDPECSLVNVNHGFSCCFAGACDQPDYSNGEWEAVNKEWFTRERTRNCPDEKNCGPAPTCPEKKPTGAYKAACINSKCVKIEIT